MNIFERAQAPTPKFFRIVRTIGLSLAAASAAILTAPIALPATIVTIAGYLAVAGTVATAVSQVAVDDGSSDDPTSLNGGGAAMPSRPK
jgi:hypothetical protein